MKIQEFKFELWNFWVKFKLKGKVQNLNFQKFKFELLGLIETKWESSKFELSKVEI
jgi:hypothetical protein